MSDVESDDTVEITFVPRFEVGERVVARCPIRNDGTYNGKGLGERLVNEGDVGYVTAIGTFLQRFYIYAVHFVENDYRVGMRAKELCTLDRLPQDVLSRLGARVHALRSIGVGQYLDGKRYADIGIGPEQIAKPFDGG
ncbi:nitrogen fixation protein NifZ [Paraburkholderia phenoliruptrix]|uniref:Nitrogen fixation protein NifZ n=1 Tax=Paraburkholderia phenoliruptrix TaxID=252970 RepID=A0ABV3WL72_9BURK